LKFVHLLATATIYLLIMHYLRLLLFSLLSATLVSCQNQVDPYDRSPVIPPARRPFPPEIVNNNLERGWSDNLVQSARNFVSSPVGQLTMSMAKEFVARSAGGNQVLSLNMSSLLVLVLLKALIFATGLLGVGNWSQYGRGRAIDGSENVKKNCLNILPIDT
jgi:hypothetical protein